MEPDQTQTIEHARPSSEQRHTHLALVIAWSREEPARIGERWVLPPSGAALIGRGGARADDPAPRLLPVRLRPGEWNPTGPLRSQRVSRQQLLLRVVGGQVSVRNIGRCKLHHNGRAVDQIGSLAVGDVLELAQQLVVLCVQDDEEMPGTARHPFGEADEHGIVGESPATWELRRQLRFIGPRRLHVLLLGASGVGKELAARALHVLSEHPDGPFIRRNAATLPDGLIDAELFGNIANYPNPGMPARPGLVGAASGGSLFLDELAELSLDAQSHLLRVLDSGEYQPLGSARCQTARFRLLAATNQEPEALKHDVLARFGLTLRLPDLNERRADIPLLVRHILRQRLAEDPELASRFRDPSGPGVSAALMCALLQHTYTTHVREISSILWQSMLESTDGTLRCPSSFSGTAVLGWSAWVGRPPADIPPEVIQACLDAHNGNQISTAEALGLSSRHVLNRLIKRHQLLVRRTLS